MAGWPLRRSCRRALLARAQHTLGDGAKELDYVLRWLRSGFTVGQLADVLALDVNHTVDRTTLSGLLKRLAPDAKQRVAETRRVSRQAARDVLRDAARRQAALDTPPRLRTPQHLVLDHLRLRTTQPQAPTAAPLEQ